VSVWATGVWADGVWAEGVWQTDATSCVWAEGVWASGVWAEGVWHCGVVTAPSITTPTLAAGQVGVAYSATITASGTTPITWAVTIGSLPAGLSLSTGGAITGTPTLDGSYTFTVQATNASGSDTQELTLLVADTVVVTPPAGGDDRPPGWSKRRAKLKLNRERALTEQIRDIYRELTADPEAAARVEALLAPVVPPAPAMGESEVARVAALEARADALRRRADAMDTQAIEVEIALRVMYGEMQDRLMADDWDAIQVLLSEVL
jgi:hypothetical protein